MGKHTTGPWHWEEGQPKITAEWNGKAYCVASVQESRLGWHEDRICEGRERGANARLIAAAPEMLEALDIVVGCLLWNKQDEASIEVMRRVNAVRAKAEGRS